MDILHEKIKLIQPNVIVTEKDISFKVLEVLKKNNIAAISNLHIDKMRKLARLTKTIIVPSANVIDKNFQLGRCQYFRVENPVNQSMFGNKNRVSSLNADRNIFSSRHQREEQKSPSSYAQIDQNKQIIFFQGCNPVLGCTIVLSGPFIEKKIKRTSDQLQLSPKADILSANLCQE